MWTCPKCERNFKSANQSHTCTTFDIGELFINKPDEMVLAFAEIVDRTENWQPNSVGAAKHSIVFTAEKAWLIIKPMKAELDVKFYYSEPLVSERFKKVTNYFGKFAHHIRVKTVDDLNDEFFELINRGHQYSLR